MIIAAYAGCGKTTLAGMSPENFIEVASMPFARILPILREEHTGNFEREKAAEYHMDNPLYPLNMVAEILKMERNYKYVIIPTDYSVIKHLQEDYNRPVILCYPEDGLEEEYRQRYLKRGNTETFCEIFADGMKALLSGLKKNKDAYHIRMSRGEFLADKIDEFEDVYRQFPAAVCPEEKIEQLKECLEKRKQNIWLYYFNSDKVIYHVKDIDYPPERLFIYMFAKSAYEATNFMSAYVFEADPGEEKFFLQSSKKPRVVDKTGLWLTMENDITETVNAD